MKNGVFSTHPDTKASKNYKRLAARLLDIPYKEEKVNIGFLDKLKELFKF